MVREFERKGFITVQITPLLTIAREMGVNRIVEGVGIPYPLGDPKLPKESELRQRIHILETAITAFETEVAGPTIFSPSMRP
jgi:glycine/betaine/sarcosine/D-proline reductase family selenoprotein B